VCWCHATTSTALRPGPHVLRQVVDGERRPVAGRPGGVRGRSAGVRFSYGGMVAFKLAEARPKLVLRNVFWASLTAGRLIIRRKPT
jgi:hypothetical protein